MVQRRRFSDEPGRRSDNIGAAGADCLIVAVLFLVAVVANVLELLGVSASTQREVAWDGLIQTLLCGAGAVVFGSCGVALLCSVALSFKHRVLTVTVFASTAWVLFILSKWVFAIATGNKAPGVITLIVACAILRTVRRAQLGGSRSDNSNNGQRVAPLLPTMPRRGSDNTRQMYRCRVCQSQLVPGASECHVCGQEFGGTDRYQAIPRLVLRGRRMILVNWSFLTVAFIASPFLGWWSIICTWVCLLVMGLLLAHGGLRVIAPRFRNLGTSLVVTSVFFFLVAPFVSAPNGVVLGTQPILQITHAIFSGVLAAATLPFAYRAWREPLAGRNPYECRQCGYFLYGLSESRCPECGTLFGQENERRK